MFCVFDVKNITFIFMSWHTYLHVNNIITGALLLGKSWLTLLSPTVPDSCLVLFFVISSTHNVIHHVQLFPSSPLSPSTVLLRTFYLHNLSLPMFLPLSDFIWKCSVFLYSSLLLYQSIVFFLFFSILALQKLQSCLCLSSHLWNIP